jgi:type III secretory pathway component EscU
MTRQVALALGYDPQRDGAPEVLAKGRGAVAERIIALARENGVFVHQDAASSTSATGSTSSASTSDAFPTGNCSPNRKRRR